MYFYRRIWHKAGGKGNNGLYEKFMTSAFPDLKHESYATEWAERFLKGNPTIYMDSKRKKIYMELLEKEDVYDENLFLKKGNIKDTDGDNVPDKIDCQPDNPNKQDYAQRGFKTFPINDEYEIEAHWERTRRGFRHIAVLKKNGVEVDKATANYLNRTWERFNYESAINKLLEKNPQLMTDKQRKDYLDALSKKNIEQVNKEFKTIGMIAQLGDVFGKTQKERIDWKKRMLKAGLPELDIPEDWETLSDKEKEARLDKVIELMKKKK